MRRTGLRLLVILLAAFAAASAARAQTPQFRHVIIVFQENRTPDNLFGSNPNFEPGVDIGTQGATSHGQIVPLSAYPINGCYDIDHSNTGFQAMLYNGADQESLAVQKGCQVPATPQYKYADNTTGQIQPYFDIATNYGFANRMFQTQQGPSFPAHLFMFSGTSAPSTDSPLFASSNALRVHENVGCIAPANQLVKLIDPTGNESTNAPIYPCYEHPALSDNLDQANIAWKYYAPAAGGIWMAPNAINHICQPSLVRQTMKCTGPDWTNGSVQPNKPGGILTDIQNCKLAPVSWVIPASKQSDHATITDGSGPAWVATIVDTLGNQPSCASGENYWSDTAIFITWDDWGGWYDHVPPFQLNLSGGATPAWGDGFTYGFRVPLLVVSAYTPAGYVDNGIHDFGGILYFIEQNFGLGFIGPNNSIYSNYADAAAAARGDSMAGFFSLSTPRPFVPIATGTNAAHFLNLPPDNGPPDDD